MKIKNYFFISLAVVSTLLSCSKSDDGIEPPVDKFNPEKLKGEWIVNTQSNNFKKVTIASDGSFNVAEVTQAWNVASPNNLGKWSVDEKSKTLNGTYEQVADGVTRAMNVSLSVKNQQDNSFEASATGEDASGTYKRLLGEVKLTRGESTVPGCLPELRVKYETTKKIVSIFETKEQTIAWEENAVLTSSNPAVATVDGQTGLITAQNENGIAFIDITTSQGTSTIKVVVDNGYESFLGKTRAEIHKAYGTANIAVENISQIMYYNNTGDFKSLKFEFKEGKVAYVGAYFKDDANTGTYKEYLDKTYKYYGQDGSLLRYIDGDTPATSSVGIVLDNSFKRILFARFPYKNDLFHNYSVALGKSKEEIYEFYSPRTEVTTETLLEYKLPNGFNNIVDEVHFSMSEGKCRSVLVNLQKSATEKDIVDYLSQEMIYEGSSTNGDHYFTSKDGNIEAGYYVKENEIMYKYIDLWDDYTNLFGKSDAEVYTSMKSKYYDYKRTYYDYSVTGSDYYIPVYGDDIVNIIGYVFNDDYKMCEYWVYLNEDFNASQIKSFLDRNFINSSEESSNTQLIYYNNSKTVKVIFDATGYVAYVGLQEKRHTSPSSPAKRNGEFVKHNFAN